MKKYLVFLSAALLLALAGCSGENEKTPSQPQPKPAISAAPPSSSVSELRPADSRAVVDFDRNFPDAFIVSTDEDAEALWSDPESNSTISFDIYDPYSDEEFYEEFSQESLHSAAQETVTRNLGNSAEANDRYYVQEVIDGLPACRYSYDVETGNGRSLTKIFLFINADLCYRFVFTAVPNADWVPTFDECAKNIHPIFE